jgi:hypothetical protein
VDIFQAEVLDVGVVQRFLDPVADGRPHTAIDN